MGNSDRVSSEASPIKPHKILPIAERRPGELVRIDCNTPDPEVVRLLERVLERAKRGEVRAFALAYQTHLNGFGRVMHVDNGSLPHLAYAIDWLKYHLVTYDDESAQPR